MEIFLVRHGDCFYSGSHETSPEEVLAELTSVGIDQLAMTGNWIKTLAHLPYGIMASSPFARSVHSAQILQMAGVAKQCTIQTLKVLEELRGLDFYFIGTLADGGVWGAGDEQVIFSVRETNPLGFCLGEYLLYDHVHKIPFDVRRGFPWPVQLKIADMELASSGIARCKRFLKGFVEEAKTDNEKAVIAVTHDGLTSWLAQLVSPTLWQLRKGFAIRFETRGQELWMTHFENEPLPAPILVPLTDPALS